MIIGSALIYFVSWNDLLKIPADIISLKTFRTYIGIMFTGVIIHFFFLLITSICYAMQKTFLPGLITFITQIMVLAFLYVPTVADIWLGKGVLIVEVFPVTLFAMHTSLSVIANVTNSFSNGFGKIKCQMVCTIAGAILKFLLIFVAVVLFKNPSWYVVMLSNVIALLPFSVVHPVYIHKYIKKESKRALEEK